MKKILFPALMAIVFACTPKHDGYIITGTLTGDNVVDGKVYLTNFSRSEALKDTAELIAGKFEFKGKVVTPEDYAITFDGVEGRVGFFLDNSKINIQVVASEPNKAVITGGVTQDLIKSLNDQKEEIKKRYNLDSLLAEFYVEGTTQARKDEIIAVYEEAQKEEKVVESAFFANNPTSYYTVTQLLKKVEEYPLDEMDQKVAAFKALPEFEGNRYLIEVEKAVEALKSVQPGMTAPEFTLNDPKGNPVSLSSVYSQHKITMIDFWAGWCGPCRKFNPTLVEIYKKYNKAGFGIIGVSLDNDESLWNKAIAEDKLTWIQVSDLQYWNSAPAKQYYVRYIPQNIFVDQEGKIIKRQVEKDEIDQFIKEFLGL
ncbi:MAG: TlpA disulfide reductase family protein [Bacteroidales bacterium]|nr:TlpA disulfide reductase family protein [Bacteroidales bacterium]